jgi:uncharacterized protein
MVLVLLVVAGFAAWYLLRPEPRQTPQREAQAPVETATPAGENATETPAPTESPSTSPTQAPTLSATASGTGPKLALIVDDCGQWVDIERGFIALPIPLTLSVLPHVHATTEIAQEAHSAGKGVMLHLPMETLSGVYPGPGEVTTEMTDAQVTAQVEDDLAQVPLAAGVNNHEGSKGSADSRVMHDVIAVLEKHGGLFFIDSRTSAASVGASVAAAAGVPTASRDVFLDNKENVAYSEQQLREAAAIAKKTGSAIAIGHPRATTLEAVRALIPEFQAEGITFVLAQSLTR